MHTHRYTNKQVKDALDCKVYGHDRAKKALITAINRPRVRWQQHLQQIPVSEHVGLKNVLLIGGSGTGKTYLVECLQTLCDFPLIRFDATQLSPSGASGQKLENLVKEIQENCAYWAKNTGNIYSADEVMRNCVVFIDEIDKLALAFDSSGKWNKQVQANLLLLLENKVPGIEGVTFVLAGAFTGMFDKSTKHGIGFNAKDQETVVHDYDEEVVKAGLITELVGRVHCIVALDELTRSDYYNILVKHIVPKAKKLLSHFGITQHEFSEYELNCIVDKAVKSGQGVRVLNREIESLIEDIEFNYEENQLLLSKD